MTQKTPPSQADHRRWDPGDHPAATELSAYLTSELSPEEDDAIQEHVVKCELCSGRLLDLQYFLDRPAEAPLEGVVDFEAAARWQELRKRLNRPAKGKRYFASARGGYSVAAALLLVSIGLAAWNLHLARQSRQPRPLATMQTLAAVESLRGGSSGEEVIALPAQIILNLPTETPAPRYLVELFSEGSHRARMSLELPAQGPELWLLLPAKALPPGDYTLRARGLRYGRPASMAWSYELTIGSREH